MLKGVKQLAYFKDAYDGFPDCVVRYLRCFDRCVERGLLFKREFVEPMSFPHLPHIHGIHTIFYTRLGEERRIDAMIELMGRSGPWTADREREQGVLFGYEDWQNDVWAQTFPFRPC